MHTDIIISTSQFMINLLLSVILGCIIGVERQWRQRLAGLRTNTLVSTGAALFVMLSQLVPDPGERTRVAAQIVSGVGFLGAGVIMKEGLTVRGLNTAATLWCSAAVGALAGFGQSWQATAGAMAILVTNLCLRPLAQKINKQPLDSAEQDITYKIKVTCRDEEETQIRYLILQSVSAVPLILRAINSEAVGTHDKVQVTADLESHGKRDQLLEQLMSRISLERGVSGVAWHLAQPETAA